MHDPTDCILGDEIHKIPREVRIIFGSFVLTHRLEETIEAFKENDGLTKPERQMLINLGVPRRMGQMAEDLNTLPSAVTAVADLLERKDLVLRERDPDDRRAWQLRLTEAGIVARRELIDRTVEAFREITGLGEAEMGQLAALMDHVTERVLTTGFPKGLSL